MYTDYRTELHLHNSVRDNMKEYYIWIQRALCGHKNVPPSFKGLTGGLAAAGFVTTKTSLCPGSHSGTLQNACGLSSTLLTLQSKQAADPLQPSVYLMLVNLTESSRCGFCRRELCKAKKDECPAAVDGGTPRAPRAGAAVHPERAQFSNILFGEKKRKKTTLNAEFLHISVGLTKLYLQVRKCRPGL